MLTMKVDESKCIGCGACTAVCSLGHGMLEQTRRVEDLPKARLVINAGQEKNSIDICRHCENAVCVNACVAGALSMDKASGIVQIDKKKCVGCWSCVMECPFCAVRIRTTAWKCDGCREWDKPLCASFCPEGALAAEESPYRASANKRRNRVAFITGRLD